MKTSSHPFTSCFLLFIETTPTEPSRAHHPLHGASTGLARKQDNVYPPFVATISLISTNRE